MVFCNHTSLDFGDCSNFYYCLSLKGIYNNSPRLARSDYLGLMPKATVLPQTPAAPVFGGGEGEGGQFDPGLKYNNPGLL